MRAARRGSGEGVAPGGGAGTSDASDAPGPPGSGRSRAAVRYRYLRRIFRRPGVRAIAVGLLVFGLMVGFGFALGPEYWRF